MTRPPLKEVVKLFGGVIAKSGTTTFAGAVTGDSIIDASLIGAGANSFVNMLVILYPGDSARVDSARITVFTNGTGEVTFEHAYKGVAAAIPAGINYVIVTFPFATAVAVAALLAALGVPGVDVATNILERDVIGNKASTAIYAKTATADIVRYLKGLLDAGIAISGTVVDGAPTVVDFDTSIVEVTNNHFNGGLLIFLDGPNAGQCHLVDVYTGAGGNCAFAASDQWTDVPVNGNSFIIIPNVGAYLKKVFAAIAGLPGDPWLTALPGAYAGGTAGKIVGDNVDTTTSSRASSAEVQTSTVAAGAGSNATLTRLGLLIRWITDILTTNLDTTISSRAPGATALSTAQWTNAIATALASYTAARAGYLDNLSAGAVALNADAVLIKASQARMLFSVDYWSVPQLSVVVPAGAANQALPNVVLDILPAGATVVKATAMFKFRSLTNAGAANKLNAAQHIQIQKGGAGGYANAISLIDDQFTIAAATVDAPGDVVIGDHNVVAKVTAADTYNFQWTSANADVAGLTFNDVQMGLRIWYSV